MDYEELYNILIKEQIQKSLSYSKYHTRSIFNLILNSKIRINIISGLRGIGKTTILMHLLDKKEHALYISLDNPILANIELYDFIKFLIDTKGIKYLLLDEVHFWLHWRKAIKSLYDIYNDVSFVLSGSSALALQNLERRAKTYFLKPLSFMEFLQYKDIDINSDVNWKDKTDCLKFIIANNLEPLYDEYIKKGGFVFGFDLNNEDFVDLLYESIMKSVREDSVLYSKISAEKRFGLEKIIIKLALSSPGELGVNSFSKELSLSKDTIYNLLDVLENAGLINSIKTYSRARYVRRESKLLFVHPNLRFVLAKKTGFMPYEGALREDSFVLNMSYMGYTVFLPKKGKKTPDFILLKDNEKYVMEVGTKNKKKTQIVNYENAYIVDDYKLICLVFSGCGRKIDQKRAKMVEKSTI